MPHAKHDPLQREFVAAAKQTRLLTDPAMESLQKGQPKRHGVKMFPTQRFSDLDRLRTSLPKVDIP